MDTTTLDPTDAAAGSVTAPMPFMTDREAFEAAVLAAPLDAAPKLVFADWLNDQGEEELATAYRWSAENQRRPRRSPAIENGPRGTRVYVPGVFYWRREGAWFPRRRVVPELVESYDLPTDIFDAIAGVSDTVVSNPVRLSFSGLMSAMTALAQALANPAPNTTTEAAS